MQNISQDLDVRTGLISLFLTGLLAAVIVWVYSIHAQTELDAYNALGTEKEYYEECMIKAKEQGLVRYKHDFGAMWSCAVISVNACMINGCKEEPLIIASNIKG